MKSPEFDAMVTLYRSTREAYSVELKKYEDAKYAAVLSGKAEFDWYPHEIRMQQARNNFERLAIQIADYVATN